MFERKSAIMFLSCVLGAQKNRLIDTVVLNTHNICFGLEIKRKSVTNSYLWAWHMLARLSVLLASILNSLNGRAD